MSPAAPPLAEILIRSVEVPWRAKSLKSLWQKMLWRDAATGASIALIRFEKGCGIPEPHSHESNQFMYCLEARYEYTATGVLLTLGSFDCDSKVHVHGPTVAHQDAVVL
jgi:2,4'-dihydroxyacetophenone dioxygenase